jgi:hypothetical protein
MKACEVVATMKKAGRRRRAKGKCSPKFKRAVKAIERRGDVDNPYAVAHAALDK